MVSVKVLYFASARDAAKNLEYETVTLSEDTGPRMTSVVDAITRRHPGLAAVLQTAAFSHNQVYCSGDDLEDIQVKDGDEIGIIPPVSGG
ncbi:Acts as a sulfur carrier required for molybdopterin biosynthesis [Coemansia erecta]|uniref:Acts as a sulfur carrier required for molybdopterin biosynthesis n=1 Tax=Coemansia erecta TaxID=147472 RepID=A0A9W7Y6Y5_9FUNG|nr:Acts as a sulfur carrier required for molybdopterin biosynthesis [Coemansia erecta]